MSSSLYKPIKELQNKLFLCLNCGSSSIKISLFEYYNESYYRIFDGNFKRIDSDKGIFEIVSFQGKEIFSLSSTCNLSEELKFILNALKDKYDLLFESLSGIGHRFVHGGDKYYSSIQITPKIILELEKLSILAPLHNKACLLAIKECVNFFGAKQQVVVFDTAFHHSLPAVSANYAIPNNICSNYNIKRYGFHGISHEFLWDSYINFKGDNFKNSKIITLHLGNGCSATAISGGISIDTSMGFTPAEGLMMATRAGDIDAAIIEFICEHDKKMVGEVMNILNQRSGLLGVSDISSNLKVLMDLYHKDEKAKLAVDMFCYRIVKYLGSYIAVLNGVEAIIFSGGIGENSSEIREQIIKKMSWFGLKLDNKANSEAVELHPGKIKKISAKDSLICLYVIATDENLFIANEINHVLKIKNSD